MRAKGKAESRAKLFNKMAKDPRISYRVEEDGKDNWVVTQYLGDRWVGVALA